MNEEDEYYDDEEYYEEDEDSEGEEIEYYAIRPNKTRIKKEIAAIFAMAEEISRLSPSHIAEFELPENVERALLDTAKMGQNAARKRQLKYVTAQLRKLDLEAVREKLDRIKNRSAHGVREHHQAERWRDRLLSEHANQALTEFISDFPAADSQYVRQLQRNAQKEAKEVKPPKSARLLYKYVKELITEFEEIDEASEDGEQEED